MFNKYLGLISILLPSLIWSAKVDGLEKSWTGVYGGGNIGGIFNRAQINARHVAFSNLDGVCNHTNHFSSAFVGGQLGFTQQLNLKLVVGVEGDYDYNFSQKSNSECDCEFDDEIYDKFQVKNRQQASIRGRLGYLYKQSLLTFVSAGASFADLGLSYTNEISNNYSTNQFQPGWLIGGGVEWAYAKSGSLRLEYYYNQYDYLNMPIDYLYSVYDGSGLGKLNLSSNNIRLGLNYWFL